MSIRRAAFPHALSAAPPDIREGVEQFTRHQAENRRTLGTGIDVTLRLGNDIYFPNAVMPWTVGMIGVVVAFVAFVGFATLTVLGLVMDSSMFTVGWIGLLGSLGLGLASIVVTAIRSPKPGTPQQSGMYLLASVAVLVRDKSCVWFPREHIREFTNKDTSAGSGTSRSPAEVLVLRDKSATSIILAAGEHESFRQTCNQWLSGAP